MTLSSTNISQSIETIYIQQHTSKRKENKNNIEMKKKSEGKKEIFINRQQNSSSVGMNDMRNDLLMHYTIILCDRTFSNDEQQ